MRLKPLLVVSIAFHASAALALSIHEPYHDGLDLCSGLNNVLPTEDPGEFGFFVDVPANYAHPGAGTVKIYAWTMRPFNPKLKTMVYFIGGPGDTSHTDLGRGISGALGDDWNAIFFDQRGNTCSRPLDKSLLLDPDFFSSETTARDANEIRKYLKIDTWSVYGQSYGTVPATIAGSLFPDSVRSVTLSGVMYSGDLSLWEAPHRRAILQRYFDGLPKKTRNRILEYSRRPDLPPFWFSSIAFPKMYDNFPLQEITSSLDQLFADSEDEITKALQAYAHPFSGMLVDQEFGWGVWLWAQLTCKELSSGSRYANFSDVFNSRDRLVPAALDIMGPICEQLGMDRGKTRTYYADAYPILAPVTYIQGGMDGPTVAPEAREHWARVPLGLAQFLYAPQGGHGIADSQRAIPAFVSAFKSALSGDLLSCTAVEAVSAGPLKFRQSAKFAGQALLPCDGDFSADKALTGLY